MLKPGLNLKIPVVYGMLGAGIGYLVYVGVSSRKKKQEPKPDEVESQNEPTLIHIEPAFDTLNDDRDELSELLESYTLTDSDRDLISSGMLTSDDLFAFIKSREGYVSPVLFDKEPKDRGQYNNMGKVVIGRKPFLSDNDEVDMDLDVVGDPDIEAVLPPKQQKKKTNTKDRRFSEKKAAIVPEGVVPIIVGWDVEQNRLVQASISSPNGKVAWNKPTQKTMTDVGALAKEVYEKVSKRKTLGTIKVWMVDPTRTTFYEMRFIL